MNQDLMEWLKADSRQSSFDEKFSSGRGLLLVPVNPDTQKIIDVEANLPAVATKIEDFIIETIETKTDDEIEEKNIETNFENKIENENQSENLEISSPQTIEKTETQDDFSNKIFDFDKSLQEIENIFAEKSESEEIHSDNKNENQSENIEIFSSQEIEEAKVQDVHEKSENFEEFKGKISELNQSLQEIENIFAGREENHSDFEKNENKIETEFENKNEATEIDVAATGFELDLSEPPPELWTKINFENSDFENENDDEDEELDYEQGMSLQGAAYVPKAPKGAPARGQNFTERLQQSMRGRKQRAEKLREENEDKKSKHPYRSKAVIICTTLLMLLGLAYFSLWFIQGWTPEKIQQRAVEKFKIGDYEGAMSLFQRGYKRYPNEKNFLVGIAKTAESSGQVQTAITAWESYINSLPKNDQNRKFAELELKRLKGEPEKKTKPVKVPVSPKKTKPKPKIISEEIKAKVPAPEIKSEDKIEISKEKEKIEEKVEAKIENKIEKNEEKISSSEKKTEKNPAAYYEFLNEGNEAYNSKEYDKAVIYFHRAIELNGSDVRAYIGLAGAYQAKGMLFDARRILYEAKRKCKKNSTVEASLKILEGSKNL